MIWTGDSARHDNDEDHPRTERQVKDLNRLCVSKFVEVFGKEKDPSQSLSIPVVPTWGNNDVLPHNIFHPGPNKWTKAFLDIWRPFIPESQRHGFEHGGWFHVEVIPDKLVVFSLNSLYFFDSNAAVDGCASGSEPGYAQFEWMRIQLQMLRERGMKAIIIGHVPPARTGGKTAWDESCWQKYTLWMHQFRDVVVGSAWGHMNIDHFMLQDYNEVDITAALQGLSTGDYREAVDYEFSIESAADYLTELRQIWSELPEPPNSLSLDHAEADSIKKGKKKDKFYKKIGGPFGERFSLSLVSPSVVPNYYPTLRLVEYNISGLDSSPFASGRTKRLTWLDRAQDLTNSVSAALSISKKKRKFKLPKSPSATSPPGPAYSPQPLTWTKYTQLYANLTTINNEPSSSSLSSGSHHKPSPKPFTFEVEYDTATDKIYAMKDLTVLSYLKLAERIGKYKPKGRNPWVKDGDFVSSESPNLFNEGDEVDSEEALEVTEEETKESESEEETIETEKKGKHKKKKKHKKHKKHKKGKKRKLLNKPWHAFVSRAFVGSKSEEELEDRFGRVVDTDL